MTDAMIAKGSAVIRRYRQKVPTTLTRVERATTADRSPMSTR